MDNILASLFGTSNQAITLICLLLAVFRVYLEVIDFDFMSLPITKYIAAHRGEFQVRRFHRMGLFFCVGYIVLFAPFYLLS